MIRKFEKSDTAQVMQIWLNGNLSAHSFINEEYWISNYSAVQEQIAKAEVFVYEADGRILGFIGITNGYIAGIFIDEKYRCQGIGKQLINYAKINNSTLILNVYKKNEKAVKFYLREGFSIASKDIEKETGEEEYTMIWKNENKTDN